MKNTINKTKREQFIEGVGLRPDLEIIGHLGQGRNISQDMGKKNEYETGVGDGELSTGRTGELTSGDKHV